MADSKTWGFYGRRAELEQLESILRRERWFFARVSGRRRIGKTALIQQALHSAGPHRVLYVQIPDSAPAGVLSSVADAMDTFGVETSFRRPSSLLALAQTIGALARAGFIVALDEFQYFSRKALHEFTSHLQAVVDELSRDATDVPGGLFVLGSLHTELVALLEDRDAPLYNRATDHVELGHLDIASILTILREHADFSPARLLFLWNLFEGVPKFYRDCFEQGVLGAPRRELLEGMFFRSSSPLRSEADNWFLSELRGRYDVVLKYVARHPGCSHADLVAHVRSVSSESPEQVGGYLKILIEKYQMIEKRLPVFARPTAKKGRYYLRDNFLRSWLDCLASPVSAINFRPMDQLVRQADERLIDAEGFGFERLVGILYEERSRKGLGDFSLTSRIQGYWERPDVEIDLVAIDEDNRRIRLGTCKRSAEKLRANLGTHRGHVERFLAAHSRFADWTTELAALSPELDAEARAAIQSHGFIVQDLHDLVAGL
jgi:AAA+ ATPase superfamily predicted ATPase